MPGTKTAIVELCARARRGGADRRAARPVLPGLPVRAGARRARHRLRSARSGSRLGAGFRAAPRRQRRRGLPQLPVEPVRRGRCRTALSRTPSPTRARPALRSSTTSPTATSSSTGASPRASSRRPGAKEVGVEMFSMSKTYGMAGWRVGFVVGNAEIVERINLLNDHCRVGIFRPIQEACIAALTGPQDSVAERRDTYQRRRDRVRESSVLGPQHLRGHLLHLAQAPRGRDRREPADRAPRRARARRRVRAERRRLRAAQPRGRRRDARARARAARHGVRRCGLDPRACELDDRCLVEVDGLDRQADTRGQLLAAVGGVPLTPRPPSGRASRTAGRRPG